MLMFGLNLVTFSYFFTIFFSDVNSAFKKAPILMLVLGVIVPFVVVSSVIGLSDGITPASKAFYYVVYCLDPLMSFFMGLMYMISQTMDPKPTWSSEIMTPTLANSAIFMAGQLVFYMLIVMTVDWYRTGIYKRVNGKSPLEATSYAKLAVYDDALEHAEKVKRS